MSMSTHRRSPPPVPHQPAESEHTSRRCHGRHPFPSPSQLSGADLYAVAVQWRIECGGSAFGVRAVASSGWLLIGLGGMLGDRRRTHLGGVAARLTRRQGHPGRNSHGAMTHLALPLEFFPTALTLKGIGLRNNWAAGLHPVGLHHRRGGLRGAAWKIGGYLCLGRVHC
jgi:hypothetical protein